VKISVVIPAHNEEVRIFEKVGIVLSYCRDNFEQTEILLVNDGSTDSTSEIMGRLAQNYGEIIVITNILKKGKGYSLREGMVRATGDYICFTDADLSAPIWQIEKLVRRIEKGFDIAIGSRALPGSKIGIHQAWYRESMGRIFNLLVRAVLPLKFKDTQCGFKLFKREAVKQIATRTTLNGFCFDVELLYIATKIGLKICEVPIIWSHCSDTKVNLFFDSARMFSDLLRIKRNDWFAKYKK